MIVGCRVESLEESFINVFTVSYFYDKDDESMLMNFIDNPIIT